MINDGTMCLSFAKVDQDRLDNYRDSLLESKLSRQFCSKEACADPPGKCVAGLPSKIGCAENVGDGWPTAAVGISANACEAVCGSNRFFVYRPGEYEETSECACGNEAERVGSCGPSGALPQLYAVRGIGCYLPEVENAATCSGHWLAETDSCVPTCRIGARLSPGATEVSCAQK